jgi:hypothetical protein
MKTATVGNGGPFWGPTEVVDVCGLLCFTMEPEWNHPFLTALVLTHNFEPYSGWAHAILSRQVTP